MRMMFPIWAVIWDSTKCDIKHGHASNDGPGKHRHIYVSIDYFGMPSRRMFVVAVGDRFDTAAAYPTAFPCQAII